jgi:DNA-binding protein YbaB
MGMFDQAKNLYQLQRQAKEIKKELKNTHIEAEVDGIIVVIDGEQEVVSVAIPEQAHQNPGKLQENLVKAFNKAIKKSQQIAADKMKPMMGGMGIPGMGG